MLITTTTDLESFCRRNARTDFICVDTEFLTGGGCYWQGGQRYFYGGYWNKLCLIQLASDQETAVIDPLSPDIDLQPLFGLLSLGTIRKVFHDVRQDVKILHRHGGFVPEPLFDTQIAAMACGFPAKSNLKTLLGVLSGQGFDEYAGLANWEQTRNTNWSDRPLSDEQLTYASADVECLKVVYHHLDQHLTRNERHHWLADQWQAIADPNNYTVSQDNYRINPKAWKKYPLPPLNGRQHQLLLHTLAVRREGYAQRYDRFRREFCPDWLLLQLVAASPVTLEALWQLPAVQKFERDNVTYQHHGRNERWRHFIGESRLPETIGTVLASELPTRKRPAPQPVKRDPNELKMAVDVLRLLLEYRCRIHEVSPLLVVSPSELPKIIVWADCTDQTEHATQSHHTDQSERVDVPCMQGWRYEVFGRTALAWLDGRLGLEVQQGRFSLCELPDRTQLATPLATADQQERVKLQLQNRILNTILKQTSRQDASPRGRQRRHETDPDQLMLDENGSSGSPQPQGSRDPSPQPTLTLVGRLLKILLSHSCSGIAKLRSATASDEELHSLATSDPTAATSIANPDDDPSSTGRSILADWRYPLFGRDALALKNGRLVCVYADAKVRFVALDGDSATPGLPDSLASQQATFSSLLPSAAKE